MSDIRVLITGDFCPNLRLSSLNGNTNVKDVLGHLTEPISNADLAITNLECPITSNDVPIVKTGPALKAEEHTLDFLINAGFNLVTLANNHIMDYGHKGLSDTFDSLNRRKIDYVGAGQNNKEASRSYIYKKSRLSIGIINVAENEWSTTNGEEPGANPINPISVFNQIQKLRTEVGRVILICHGGHEMYQYPSPRMKEWYRAFIDMGADAVVNHHTHCVSGYEVYIGKPIFYSLGNFLFDKKTENKSVWNIGKAVELLISNEGIGFNIYYFEQCTEQLGITEVKDLSELSNSVEKINKTIYDDKVLGEKFRQYCHSNRRTFKSYLEPYRSKLLIPLMNRGFIPSIWNNRKKVLLENLVRCEAHRDVLLNHLRNENSHSE